MVQDSRYLDTLPRSEATAPTVAPAVTDGHPTIRPSSLAKGAVAGVAAGLAGAAAMAALMKAGATLAPKPVKQEVREMREGMDETRLDAIERVADVPPQHEQKAIMAAHFATGAVGGAIYGVAAEIDERVTWGHGAAFGVAFWAVSAGIALPALGLSPPLTKQPMKAHAETLGMHLVYGLVTESVRAPTRRALG